MVSFWTNLREFKRLKILTIDSKFSSNLVSRWSMLGNVPENICHEELDNHTEVKCNEGLFSIVFAMARVSC